ncbi:uncharacterized protein [Amphiura filiformis]|uniref:uncharacterized protein n=1 Tax=Amphiura filiformis TaxID=82378 RepID=UPI003B228DCF
MGLVETFLKHDDSININGFKWFGKNRSLKGGGGIGFLISDKVNVIDDNLLDSSTDEIERLWLKISTENGPIFIAVAYFPVEGTDIERTDELYNQLLSDCIRIEESCVTDNINDPRIIIMSDCNGRIGKEIPFCDEEINVNGQRLLNFRDDSGLHILNCNKLCKGKFTWFRHDLKSAIDYILCSESVINYVKEIIIDDEHTMNLGSDHDILLLKCAFSKSKHVQKQDDRFIWDISPNQDWSTFQNEISYNFSDWNIDQFDNIDYTWDSFKDNVIRAATKTIGTRKINSKLRNWWDKDIDGCIKERKDACRKHRNWCKGDKNDKDLGQDLWDDYQTKQHHVKSLIKEKIMQKRIERSIEVAKEGGPHCRNFWHSLRGNKRKQDIYSLKDPCTNEIINNGNKMKQCVLYYWRTLGKMNRELNEPNNETSTHDIKELVSQYRSYTSNLINDEYLHTLDLTIEMVHNALKSSKNNKSPGIDGITNELLNNGGNCLVNDLFELFKKIIDTNIIPKEWNVGVIIPIFKKGDHKDLNNYRGITLTSCISKVFNRIIANAISYFLEKDNILSEVQGGFRKDYRCEDHIFTVQSIAASRLAEGKATYMAFLDFRKAFDTVWRMVFSIPPGILV